MRWRITSSLCALLATACTGAALAATPTLEPSDAPDPRTARPAAVVAPDSYAAAVAQWRSAEALNDWIGARFVYDRTRALQLSETARASGSPPLAIVEPAAFFATPHGVCVDLARFAVDTLRRIDADAQPAYLMIEFEPVQWQGQVLRRHWMASFRRDGAWWFFADSKRPGYLAGPYATVEQFVAEYASYRGRVVLGHRLLTDYARRTRAKAPRAPQPPQPG